MNSEKALAKLARHAGIVPTYRDLARSEKPTSRDTRLALLRASGWQIDNDAMIVDALKQSEAAKRERILPSEIIVLAGHPAKLATKEPGIWQLVFEGGKNAVGEGRSSDFINLPRIPSGVHQLTFHSGGKTELVRVIAAPQTAPSVVDITGGERLWGINLALYGLHSKRNPGIGDYEDLKQASTAFAGYGADFCGINPVHAIGWNSEEVISPYSPSHRGFLNSNHIAIDRIEPVSDATSALIAVWRKRATKHTADHVDYASHAEHHHPLLQALFEDFKALATPEQRTALESFCEVEGAALQGFAQYEHLSDQFGADWRNWRTELHRQSLADEHEEPGFHVWLQWHAETQLQAAHHSACSSGMNLGLYLDLAVGARRDGAEAWLEQDSVAENVSIGAPPDHLSPAGQNWNLTAFAPHKLASTNYRAFRNILGRNMRHCGLLRIDHVLGLNRSFWIPDDGTPGGYIKHNLNALLALVRIEAERSGTIIIGEDLGLVPAGFRKTLQESGIYSYSVLQYEKTRSGAFRKPSRLRKNSLACFGTHDTPTLSGFAEGRDIDWWQKLGWIDEKSANETRQERKREIAQLKALVASRLDQNPTKDDEHISSLSQSVHTVLAASPVAMVSVQLDDIEAKTDAQNLPGTIEEHPNWQRRSSTSADNLIHHPDLRKIGGLMVASGRGIRMVEQREIHDEE